MKVGEDEVLLLWRALRAFRSGARPRCAPRRRPATSDCPMFDRCPRWQGQPDDRTAILVETAEQTEDRQSSWPCTRLLGVLGTSVTRIGR
jgi:hypothetical protein